MNKEKTCNLREDVKTKIDDIVNAYSNYLAASEPTTVADAKDFARKTTRLFEASANFREQIGEMTMLETNSEESAYLNDKLKQLGERSKEISKRSASY